MGAYKLMTGDRRAGLAATAECRQREDRHASYILRRSTVAIEIRLLHGIYCGSKTVCQSTTASQLKPAPFDVSHACECASAIRTYADYFHC
jgi:hypothetical protein